ncbi:hypothetical protein HDU98_011415 [Podochytrium sp. JEL0797]|nr:hypothetical protein HDU98_011415 [Podochytrium sp. JEL0797]
MLWHDQLTTSLATRDLTAAQFASTFCTANALSAKTTALSQRIVSLEGQVDVYKTQFLESQKMLSQAQETGSPDAQRKFGAMEQQLRVLQDERVDLFKTQSQNAQRLVSMNETIQAEERNKKILMDDRTKYLAANNSLNIKLRDALDLLKEKDGVIQILKDEMAALQLEIVQREEQWKLATEKAKKLEAENNELVERWIKLKQEEASKMNEVNEFVVRQDAFAFERPAFDT